MKKLRSILKSIAIVSLFTLLYTPQPTKAKIPELKGLYTLFSPDTIGLGQALFYSQWIENVYTYAPENDAAHELISEFWYKISEYDNFLPAEKLPVNVITPSILGKLINFAKEKEKTENADSIINEWVNACEEEIKKLAETITNIKAKELSLKEIEGKKDYKKNLRDYKKKKSESVKKLKQAQNIEKDLKKLKRKELSEAVNDIKEFTLRRIKDINKAKKSAKKNITNLKKLKKMKSKQQKEFDEKIKKKIEYYKKEVEKLKNQMRDQEENLKTYNNLENQEIVNQFEKTLLKEIEILKTEAINIMPKVDPQEERRKHNKHKGEINQKYEYLISKKEREKKGVTSIIEKSGSDPKRYLTEKIKEKIKKIIEKIVSLKLQEEKNYIAGITEGILWAYFENKFDGKESLDKCLKELLDKSIKKELYEKGEYRNFEDEIGVEKTKEDDWGEETKYIEYKLKPSEILEKITTEYGRATYSAIERARTKIVPPKAQQTTIPYEYETNKKTIAFPTCFESSILDTISVLFYDPKKEIYDEESLKKYKKLEKVFKRKKDFVEPKDINSIIQKWINTVSGLDNISYSKKINGKNSYDLNCTFENFIKILNHFFELELKIKQNSTESLILNIEHINKVQNPKNRKEFWEQIFLFLSSKFSSEKRKATFSAKLDETRGTIKIEKNIVTTEKTIGIINIKVEYQQKEYQDYNFDFDIHVKQGHAYTSCKKREEVGLKIYNQEIKKLLTTEFYSTKETKLAPLFLLLTNSKTTKTKGEIPILNLLFYSLDLKDNETKKSFLEDTISKDLLKETIFKGLELNLLSKLPDDPNITLEILNLIKKHYSKDIYKKCLSMKSLFSSSICAICASEKIEKYEMNIFNERLNKIKEIIPTRYNRFLHIAAKYGNTDVFIKAILEKGANIEAKDNNGYTPLHYATKYRKTNVVKFLIEKNANIKIKYNNEDTPLHLAAEYDLIATVKLLIEKNANVNTQNKNKETPLHLAALNGHIDSVKLLIENKAKIETKDEEKNTPLHLAALNGHIDSVKLLIEKKAKIEAQNALYKMTPLHLAAENGYPNIVKLLIEKKAKIDAKDSLKRTPLHLATENGYPNIVKTLLNAPNIDVSLKNFDEKTALDITEDDEIKRLILEHIEKKKKI